MTSQTQPSSAVGSKEPVTSDMLLCVSLNAGYMVERLKLKIDSNFVAQVTSRLHVVKHAGNFLLILL